MNLVRIATENNPLQNDMHRITLDQLAIHDRTWLRLLQVERVNLVDGERSRWEVVIIVEGT
jgi:hypothetical protein